MRSLSILAGVVLIALIGNSVFGMDKKAVDELIAKMEKAVDPHGVEKNIKTQVSKVEILIPAQKIKLNTTILDKFPDKTRTVTEIPKIMTSTRVYNGKKGWEFSTSMGLREITGKELDGMKLEMDMKNPLKEMRDVFSDIQVLDDTVKVGEFDCYKLTCVPKKEYNAKDVVMYVDNKAFLLRKIEMILDTQMGPVKMESIIKDYKEVDKMFIPMASTIKQLSMEMEVKILEVKNNLKLDDSKFEKPKAEDKEPIRARDK